MKFLLPVLLGLLIALHAPAFAQEDGSEPMAADASQTGGDTDGGMSYETDAVETPAEEQAGGLEQMQDMADQYRQEHSGETPSVEDMKSFADKYDIKPPSAEAVRNFARQHEGKIDKARDYAKQFQEFRREQREENQTGSMAPE